MKLTNLNPVEQQLYIAVYAGYVQGAVSGIYACGSTPNTEGIIISAAEAAELAVSQREAEEEQART